MYNIFDDWFSQMFIEMHDEEPAGKFQPGEKVRYISQKFLWHEVLKNFIGCDFEVLAVNVIDEENVEYLLKGFPFLVWEYEICSTLGLEKYRPSEN